MITDELSDPPADRRTRNTLIPVAGAAALGGALVLWLATTGHSSSGAPKPTDTCPAAAVLMNSFRGQYIQAPAGSDVRTWDGRFELTLIAQHPTCFTAEDRAQAEAATGTSS
ncbi:hypothetical protein P3T29_006462 [Kitasatospora sp. MAP5-34]|nr:hypothetical protein [Kitasatospora sp. MAP5-34]